MPRLTQDQTIAELRLALAARDPALFDRVKALLETLPWTGKRATGGWRAIFEVLAALKDPRTHELVERLPPSWKVGESMQRFLTNRLTEAAEGIPRPVAAPVASAAPRARKAATSGDELLAAVYAHPDDDAPRQVYGDWLQEQGDPRGEFIALQLRGAGTPGDLKRERALLKAHGKQWLGALAPALGAEVEFRRGFPAKAELRLRSQRDAELHAGQAAWATFEELKWNSGSSTIRDDQREWAGHLSPKMTGLRVALDPSPRFLLAASAPWRIERLALSARFLGRDGFLQVLGARGLLPHLRALWLQGWGSEPDWLGGRLPWCPAQLELNTSLEHQDLPKWLRAATAIGGLERLILHGYPRYRTRCSRDSKGKFTQLEFELDLFGNDTLEDQPKYLAELKKAVQGFERRWPHTRTAVAIGKGGVRTSFDL